MTYFIQIKSMDELTEEGGILRLPRYIFEEFVFDNQRKNALNEAINALLEGNRVLIVGRAGTGKTALMAIVLKELIHMGFSIGAIIDETSIIGKKHEELGIIIFYDDIPRMGKIALSSIIKNNVGSLIATAREEELDELEAKIGLAPEKAFYIVEISELNDEDIKKILIKFARKEGIQLERGVEEIIAKKAKGLPIYVWQLIRDLKASRMNILNREFAETIPKGMLEYVDEILWRLLRDKDTRTDALLTLRIMADTPSYELHQDLFNMLYATIRNRLSNGTISIKKALLDGTIDKVNRYLIKTRNYSFRLPHDCWADVLHGKSKGLIAPEISKINSVFPYEKRMQLLEEAAKKCEEIIISRIAKEDRKKAFYRNLQQLGIMYGNVEVNSPKLIILALTGKQMKEFQTDVEKIAWDIAQKLTDYFTSGDVDFINLAMKKIDSIKNNLSSGDLGVFLGLINTLSRKYTVAAYNLKRAIWYYGNKQIVDMLKITLMNSPPEHVSDILATIWTIGEIFFSEFIKSAEYELKYAIKRMKPHELVKELSDICYISLDALKEVHKVITNEIKEVINSVNEEGRALLLAHVKARKKICRERLVSILEPAMILTEDAVSRLNLSDLLRILKVVEEYDENYALRMVKSILPNGCGIIRKANYVEIKSLMASSKRYKSIYELMKSCAKEVSDTIASRKLQTIINMISRYSDILNKAGIYEDLVENIAIKAIDVGIYEYLALLNAIEDRQLIDKILNATGDKLVTQLRREIESNFEKLLKLLPIKEKLLDITGKLLGEISNIKGTDFAIKAIRMIDNVKKLSEIINSFILNTDPKIATEVLVETFLNVYAYIERDTLDMLINNINDHLYLQLLILIRDILTLNSDKSKKVSEESLEIINKNPILILALSNNLEILTQILDKLEKENLVKTIKFIWLSKKEIIEKLPEKIIKKFRGAFLSLPEHEKLNIIYTFLSSCKDERDLAFLRHLIPEVSSKKEFNILSKIALWWGERK